MASGEDNISVRTLAQFVNCRGCNRRVSEGVEVVKLKDDYFCTSSCLEVHPPEGGSDGWENVRIIYSAREV